MLTHKIDFKWFEYDNFVVSVSQWLHWVLLWKETAFHFRIIAWFILGLEIAGKQQIDFGISPVGNEIEIVEVNPQSFDVCALTSSR